MGGYWSKRPASPADKPTEKTRLQQRQQRDTFERLNMSASEGEEDGEDTTDGKTKKCMHPTKKLNKIPSILSDTDIKAMHADPSNYSYPFENLVFEGGGNKGLAYCGAIRVLEELGIKPQIKRMAGASAGAMTAALLAAGYDSYQIEEFLSQDLSHMFLDASFGILSLLPNLLRGYGWNPGNRIFKWFGDVMAKKFGDPDVTFHELYKKTGVELCVVVTNLNHMTEEYCHPKTTPDMAIRVAVRMSMSIPGMFQAAKYAANGEENTYVDGGVLCNYPLHCFDGWWLSMKPGDSFLQRLQPLEDLPKILSKNRRFGETNMKTLGFLLYADSEHEMFRFELEQRIGTHLPELPKTELAQKKTMEKKMQDTVHREHRRVTNAVNQFLKVLNKHDVDQGGTICLAELEEAFKDEELKPETIEMLFGKNCKVQEAFDILDEDKDGEIEYHELIHFVENTGVFLTQRYLGYQRKEISGLLSFFDTLQNALLTNVKRIYVQEQDLARTVGINTGHVGTSDFTLEQGDRDFVVEQGRRAVNSFLKYYAVHNNLQPRRSQEAASPSGIKLNNGIPEEGEQGNTEEEKLLSNT